MLMRHKVYFLIHKKFVPSSATLLNIHRRVGSWAQRSWDNFWGLQMQRRSGGGVQANDWKRRRGPTWQFMHLHILNETKAQNYI